MNPLRPKSRPDLAIVELDGETVIYDEKTGDLHHLNRTATILFSLCDGTASVGEVASDIAQIFQLPIEDVSDQLETLLSQLQQAQLLESDLSPNNQV